MISADKSTQRENRGPAVTAWDATAAGQTGKKYLKADALGSPSACTHTSGVFGALQDGVIPGGLKPPFFFSRE